MSGDELGRVFKDGEAICQEGEAGQEMYVIQSGKVRITRVSDGRAVTIKTLGAGEILGEMSIFDNMPRSASAVAEGEARVLSVDKKKLFKTISRDPTLVFKMLESMSQRIRFLTDKVLEYGKTKTELMRASFNLDQTCEIIIEEVKQMMSAENGSIMLLQPDGMTILLKSAFGTESKQKADLVKGEGIAGIVLETGEAELVNNVTLDGRFKPGGGKISSLICVPLKHEAKTFGVINVSTGAESLFTVEDLKRLNSISSWASIAILNADSFSRLDSSIDEIIQQMTFSRID